MDLQLLMISGGIPPEAERKSMKPPWKRQSAPFCLQYRSSWAKAANTGAANVRAQYCVELFSTLLCTFDHVVKAPYVVRAGQVPNPREGMHWRATEVGTTVQQPSQERPVHSLSKVNTRGHMQFIINIPFIYRTASIQPNRSLQYIGNSLLHKLNDQNPLFTINE